MRRGFWVGLALLGLGVISFYGATFLAGTETGGDKSRNIETAGVLLTMAGALTASVCYLLRRLSLFAALPAMGIIFGVMGLTLVFAVTGGFEQEFKRKILDVNAHITVNPYGIFDSAEEAETMMGRLEAAVDGLPHLKKVSRFAFTAGEVLIGPGGASLKGVDRKNGTIELERNLKIGATSALDAPATCRPADAIGKMVGNGQAGRLIIGQALAEKIKAKVGDCVPVLVPFGDKDTMGIPPPFWFKIVGLFEMGFHEYDSRLAYTSMEDMLRLRNVRHSIIGVELRFDDEMTALRLSKQVAETVRQTVPAANVVDWRTLNGGIFRALVIQKIVISIILTTIIIIAAINVLASLSMTVLSKVQEIAIMSSLGAQPRSIWRVFLIAGSGVGLLGTAFGVALGLLACGVLHQYGYNLDAKVYNIAEMPIRLSATDLAFIAG